MNSEGIRTPAERTAAARALLDGYKGPNTLARGIGFEVIAIVLDGRSPEMLESDEFAMLLRGYNWAGAHEVAFAWAKHAVRKWGDHFLPDLVRELQNAYLWKGLELLAHADELIAEGLGPAWRWRLSKVHRLLAEATLPSEQDWAPGDPIVDVGALEAAAHELELALETAPRSSWGSMAELDEWLAPIFHQPEFFDLRERVRIACTA